MQKTVPPQCGAVFCEKMLFSVEKAVLLLYDVSI